MQRAFAFVMLIFMSNSSLLAQINASPHGTIRGVVLEENTQEPVSYALIRIEGTARFTTADAAGHFVLSDVPPGTYTLLVSVMGSLEKRLEEIRVEDQLVTDIGQVYLLDEGIMLREVTVSPGSFSIMNTVPSRQTLSGNDLENITWAEDITRAVARLPGVSSNDFSSKFTVRGGEADEILMTIDGMELYDPFHQRDISGGIFSIIDIETIQAIDLLTGGFTAEYGNRQSAVFNMKTKQKMDEKRHSSIGISLMNARAYTDGTFAGDKGFYFCSARRGMLDFIFKVVGPGESIPYYSDIMAKADYKLTEKHRLSFHVLQSNDKTQRSDLYLMNYDSNDIRYSNTYAWMTLQSTYHPKLYSRTIGFTGFNKEDRNGSYFKDEYGDVGTFFLKDKRKFSFFGVKQDWTWEVSDRVMLKAGFDVRHLQADYNYYYSLEDIRVNTHDSLIHSLIVVDVKSKPKGQQAGMYLSGRFQVLPSLFMETGLRYDGADHTGDQLWSPRISMAYAFSKNTFLRAAWGYYYQSQFINNLDVNHNASVFNEAELSEHHVVGLEHLFLNGLSLRIEGYYKNMPRINPIYQNLRDPLEVFPEARNDVIKLNINGTTSKGVECFIKYDRGKNVSCWLSYALAKVEDEIESIEFDGLLTPRTGKIPRNTNQLHTIYADVNYRPGKKWHFSMSWQFYTGWHRTNYHYNHTIIPEDRLIFYPVHEVYNGVAYPAYHRMDLRINRHFYLRKSKMVAFLHIINLYNQKNLRKFDIGATDSNDNLIPDGQGGYITPRGDKYWFGITPVVGGKWEF